MRFEMSANLKATVAELVDDAVSTIGGYIREDSERRSLEAILDEVQRRLAKLK